MTEAESEAIHKLIACGECFLTAIKEIGTSAREMALARTKIEEAVMWATRSVVVSRRDAAQI